MLLYDPTVVNTLDSVCFPSKAVINKRVPPLVIESHDIRFTVKAHISRKFRTSLKAKSAPAMFCFV